MAISPTLRFTILSRDGFECVYCHATDKPLEVDHVRPVALGGTDVPENLVAACSDCNGGKSAGHLASLEDFPRPNLMHDAAYIATLEARVEELLTERQELRRQQRARQATGKQLADLQARTKTDMVPKALSDMYERMAEANGASSDRWERDYWKLRGVIDCFTGIFYDYDAYIEASGIGAPPWRGDTLAQMAGNLPSNNWFLERELERRSRTPRPGIDFDYIGGSDDD